MDKRLITASPLDYHVFSQNIAKYLAEDPPKPLLLLESATNSFLRLCAINTATGRRGGNGDVLFGGKASCENSVFILNKEFTLLLLPRRVHRLQEVLEGGEEAEV